MYLFRIPNVVSKILEKLARDFLRETRKVDKRKGLLLDLGLGIGNVRARNKVLLAKWLMQIHHDYDTLWHKLLLPSMGFTLLSPPSPSLGFHHLLTIRKTTWRCPIIN